MPQGFNQIPDWFSFENQGAGVAVGRNNLFVMMVDHPGQQPNRGLYRMGRNLDADGMVTGKWTDWLDIPDWFSFENQGADIATADLFNSGSLDLVVLMVDNPPGQNRGVYRVGRRP